MSFQIPIYKPDLSGNEKEYVMDCINSSWISSKGKYISQFENSFSDYLGIPYSTAVCNGTVALHLALLALGIGKDDEVIVPTLTYIASVNAISYTGAKPVFVDSLDTTWQMNPDEILLKITSKTKAILAVHLYGHSCDLNRIVEIAKLHKLYLIEDCAEALGSMYNNRFVGTFGDIATFSFFGNKTITTGEGGMVVTNNFEIHKLVNKLKGQGLSGDKEYWHDIIGYNYRMTNICAAIGLAQIERIDRILYLKKQLAYTYMTNLDSNKFSFHLESDNIKHTYWMFTILVNSINDRDKLRNYLHFKGIETRPIFNLVSDMPMYEEQFNIVNLFPISKNLSMRGINLPSFPSLTDQEVNFIIDTLNTWENA